MKATHRPLLLSAALALTVFPAAAAGDEADPRFLSVLHEVRPDVPALELRVLARGDELRLSNRTGQTVLVEGYGGEPYLRFKPGGMVEENQRSPSTYLNADRYGTQKVPPEADEDARPAWKLVSRDGAYSWHDHRAHYMGKGTPRAVKDESKRQKVFDWTVRMRLGSRPVVASGTLFWTPIEGSGGSPAALIVVIGVLTLAAVALGIRGVARRRRSQVAGAEERPGADAW
jgi:hypothetical protein